MGGKVTGDNLRDLGDSHQYGKPSKSACNQNTKCSLLLGKYILVYQVYYYGTVAVLLTADCKNVICSPSYPCSLLLVTPGRANSSTM